MMRGCPRPGDRDSVRFVRERRSSPGLRAALFFGLSLSAPIALSISASRAGAGELRARVIYADRLRPTMYASASATDQHLYTLREFDPLVRKEYTTIGADPEKDVAIGVYGSGGNGFGNGFVVHLAGGRASPGTVVIPTGVAVVFHNDDPFTHHIVGPDFERELKPGEEHTYQPKGKGLLGKGGPSLTDTLVNSVACWIVVDDGVVADRAPAHDGTVKIAFDAAGDYTFKFFVEGAKKAELDDVKIPATGSYEPKDPVAVASAPSGSAK